MSAASNSISNTALVSSIAAIAAGAVAILISLLAVARALKQQLKRISEADETAHSVQIKADGDSIELSDIPKSAIDSAIADLRRASG
jgi:hypothetical protein